MTVTLAEEFASGMLAYEITGVASAVAAAQGSILNPFGVAVNVVRAYLVPSVESTGSANLGIGITTAAAKATDVLNDLDMNGVTIGKAINCFANDPGAKTDLVPAIWTAAKYLTFSGSATLVGFVGTLYLEVIRTTA